MTLVVSIRLNMNIDTHELNAIMADVVSYRNHKQSVRILISTRVLCCNFPRKDKFQFRDHWVKD